MLIGIGLGAAVAAGYLFRAVLADIAYLIRSKEMAQAEVERAKEEIAFNRASSDQDLKTVDMPAWSFEQKMAARVRLTREEATTCSATTCCATRRRATVAVQPASHPAACPSPPSTFAAWTPGHRDAGRRGGNSWPVLAGHHLRPAPTHAHLGVDLPSTSLDHRYPPQHAPTPTPAPAPPK